MSIDSDICIHDNGDIRYCGRIHSRYPVPFFKYWLGKKQKELQKQIIQEDRASHIVTLLPPYNIDTEMAKHLKEGSVQCGEDVWSS